MEVKQWLTGAAEALLADTKQHGVAVVTVRRLVEVFQTPNMLPIFLDVLAGQREGWSKQKDGDNWSFPLRWDGNVPCPFPAEPIRGLWWGLLWSTPPAWPCHLDRSQSLPSSPLVSEVNNNFILSIHLSVCPSRAHLHLLLGCVYYLPAVVL